MNRLPPALAASATPRILDLLPPPPARVLELGFAGVHAGLLRLAGYDVTVVEPDSAYLEAARERAGAARADLPDTSFEAVIAPDGFAAPRAPLVLRVGHDGSVWRSTSD